MTNFQAQPPSRFGITPERLVLVLPAVAGGLLAAGLALAWLLPAWQRNGAFEQQRQLLKSQGEALAANMASTGCSKTMTSVTTTVSVDNKDITHRVVVVATAMYCYKPDAPNVYTAGLPRPPEELRECNGELYKHARDMSPTAYNQGSTNSD